MMRLHKELPEVLKRHRRFIERVEMNPRSVTGIFNPSNPFVKRRCFFKIPFDEQAIEPEVKDLELAAHVTRDVAGARALRTLMVLPEDRLVLTEIVESQGSVFNLLATSSRWWGRTRWTQHEMKTMGRALGQWLRAYHEGTRQQYAPQPEMVERLKKNCVGRLERIKGFTSGVISQALEEHVCRLAEALANDCADLALSVSRTHSDLNLSNVLVDSMTGELVIIDFGDARDGISLEDTVHVLHTVVTLIQSSDSLAEIRTPFAQGVVEGYGFQDADRSLIGLLQTMCAVRMIQVYHEFKKLHRFTGLLTAMEYRRCARNSLHWLRHYRAPEFA